MDQIYVGSSILWPETEAEKSLPTDKELQTMILREIGEP
jgi:hypothetical protein